VTLLARSAVPRGEFADRLAASGAVPPITGSTWSKCLGSNGKPTAEAKTVITFADAARGKP